MPEAGGGGQIEVTKNISFLGSISLELENNEIPGFLDGNLHNL
jgi:hypothetical protein